MTTAIVAGVTGIAGIVIGWLLNYARERRRERRDLRVAARSMYDALHPALTAMEVARRDGNWVHLVEEGPRVKDEWEKRADILRGWLKTEEAERVSVAVSALVAISSLLRQTKRPINPKRMLGDTAHKVQDALYVLGRYRGRSRLVMMAPPPRPHEAPPAKVGRPWTKSPRPPRA